MYPKADIPVVQLSVHPFLSPKEQFNIGQALQGIGEEDILVIGSGTTVHNLRWFYPDATEPAEVINQTYEFGTMSNLCIEF
jgi:4,5-DOPA dioxygenase extradiol